MGSFFKWLLISLAIITLGYYYPDKVMGICNSVSEFVLKEDGFVMKLYESVIASFKTGYEVLMKIIDFIKSYFSLSEKGSLPFWDDLS